MQAKKSRNPAERAIAVHRDHIVLRWRPAPTPEVDALVRALAERLNCAVADLERCLLVDPVTWQQTVQPLR